MYRPVSKRAKKEEKCHALILGGVAFGGKRRPNAKGAL
jgi:hypothetical protein